MSQNILKIEYNNHFYAHTNKLDWLNNQYPTVYDKIEKEF